MIGCITVVKHEGMIVALECAKGRGTILPGGKWQQDETFIGCAQRELFEETGLIGKNFKPVFGGPAGDGFYCYAFTAEVEDFFPISSLEGKVILTTWDELMKSKFSAYYELLRMHIGE